MGLLGCCTTNPHTSLNMGIGVCYIKTLLSSIYVIIGVLHPKPPHQSQWDYWGAAPQSSSPVSMGLLGCCTPNLLTSLPMGLLGCCTPNLLTSFPMGLLGCCTLNLLTSLPMGLLGCCTKNLLKSQNGIIGVLYHKPPH